MTEITKRSDSSGAVKDVLEHLRTQVLQLGSTEGSTGPDYWTEVAGQIAIVEVKQSETQRLRELTYKMLASVYEALLEEKSRTDSATQDAVTKSEDSRRLLQTVIAASA